MGRAVCPAAPLYDSIGFRKFKYRDRKMTNAGGGSSAKVGHLCLIYSFALMEAIDISIYVYFKLKSCHSITCHSAVISYVRDVIAMGVAVLGQ